MVREACHRLTSLVTWPTRMESAWQSSVTTVKAEHWWMDATLQDVTHVTFITQERVCRSWRVSPESPYTASSLSNMNVMVRRSFTSTTRTAGGYRVMTPLWSTGEELHQAVADKYAHAGWPILAQTPVVLVTVMRTTVYGVKTAVSWPTRHSFQLNSSDLETRALIRRVAPYFRKVKVLRDRLKRMLFTVQVLLSLQYQTALQVQTAWTKLTLNCGPD